MARRLGDIDDPDPEPDTLGFAETGDGEPDRPAAVLWIPDIDARHKWREYAVYRDPPARRPMGFRSTGRGP